MRELKKPGRRNATGDNVRMQALKEKIVHNKRKRLYGKNLAKQVSFNAQVMKAVALLGRHPVLPTTRVAAHLNIASKSTGGIGRRVTTASAGKGLFEIKVEHKGGTSQRYWNLLGDHAELVACVEKFNADFLGPQEEKE